MPLLGSTLLIACLCSPKSHLKSPLHLTYIGLVAALARDLVYPSLLILCSIHYAEYIFLLSFYFFTSLFSFFALLFTFLFPFTSFFPFFRYFPPFSFFPLLSSFFLFSVTFLLFPFFYDTCLCPAMLPQKREG